MHILSSSSIYHSVQLIIKLFLFLLPYIVVFNCMKYSLFQTNSLAISYKLLKHGTMLMMKRQDIHVIYLLFSTKQRTRRRRRRTGQIKLKNLTAQHLKLPLHVFFSLNCREENKSCGRYFQALTVQRAWMSPQCCNAHTFPSLSRLCLPQLRNMRTQKPHQNTQWSQARVRCFSVVD